MVIARKSVIGAFADDCKKKLTKILRPYDYPDCTVRMFEVSGRQGCDVIHIKFVVMN